MFSVFCFRFSEFEVPSLNFPGQVHLWKLSQFLQKGSEPTKETLLGDLALAAQFIVITARARIVGHFFSVKEAAKAFMSGLLKLIDMVVGIPSLLAHNLENKVKEERCRYLIAELVCRVSFFEFALRNKNLIKVFFHSLNTKTASTRCAST
jgi:hypothetical protein